ncbi:MAG: hypothetical protein ACMUIP_07010 [bacterium]
MKKEDYELIFKITKIGTRAVKNAQEENRKYGLPSVYSKNRKIYYELPDGTITSEDQNFNNLEPVVSDKPCKKE